MLSTKKIRTGLRIPPNMNDELAAAAEKRFISKNSLMLRILNEWLSKERPSIKRSRK